MFASEATHAVRVDGSQPHSNAPDMAWKLKEFNPDASVILVIREPVQRLMSIYLFFYPGHRQDDFEAWLKDQDVSHFKYLAVVQAYYEHFRDNLLVVDNEELSSDPAKTMQRIFAFLDLDPFTVSPIRSNVSVFSLNDSRLYRMLAVHTLRAANQVTRPLFWLARKTNIYYKDSYLIRMARRYRPSELARRALQLFARADHGPAHNPGPQGKPGRGPGQSGPAVPHEPHKELEADYRYTLQFARTRSIFLESAARADTAEPGQH